MALDQKLGPVLTLQEKYVAPEIEYCLEDFEAAIEALEDLDHGPDSPWAYLGENLVVVLQKLSVIRHYLINPSDQQRQGVHSLNELFAHTFPHGLNIGKKVITSGTLLNQAIDDIASMQGYQIPRIALPDFIPPAIHTPGLDDEMVIDEDDVF